jgi:hypothetical protein
MGASACALARRSGPGRAGDLRDRPCRHREVAARRRAGAPRRGRRDRPRRAVSLLRRRHHVLAPAVDRATSRRRRQP